MNPESWLALAAALVFSCGIALIWRHSRRAGDEFFHFDRAHHIRRVRLISTLALTGAVLAVGVLLWLNAGMRADQARLEQRIADVRLELAETRSQLHGRARVAAAGTAPATPVAQAIQMVNVPHAIVRSAPGGNTLFVLPQGFRVTIDGRPVQVGGRTWQRIADDQGRRGWIAVELLS